MVDKKKDDKGKADEPDLVLVDVAQMDALKAELAAAVERADVAELRLMELDDLSDVAGLGDAVEGVAVAPVQGVTLAVKAKVLNAFKALPVGYKVHSSDPILRAYEWIGKYPDEAQDAAAEVVIGLGASDPAMISGSGWLAEGAARMATIMGNAAPGKSDPGATPAQLAQIVERERAARSAASAALAAEQLDADVKLDANKQVSLANAFGVGAVKVEEEEDMTDEPI